MSTTRRKWFQSAGAAGGGLLVAGASPAKDSEAPAILSVFPKRQTVRRYKMDAVPDEHVRQILDAARRAPTCMNQQPWKFLITRDRAKIDAMRKKTLELVAQKIDEYAAQHPDFPKDQRKAESLKFSEGYFTAPVYVTILVDTEAPCSNYAMRHDGPLAVGYLMLAARALGYGTAYLTDGIPESVTRDVLNIPPKWHRICITPIGIPDGWPDPKPKKKLEELVAYETV